MIRLRLHPTVAVSSVSLSLAAAAAAACASGCGMPQMIWDTLTAVRGGGVQVASHSVSYALFPGSYWLVESGCYCRW